MKIKRITKLSLKKELFVLTVILSLSSSISAQLQLYTAKDKNYSSIDYEICTGSSGRDLMIAKGYNSNNISWQPADMDSSTMKKGFYVLVKSVRKGSDGITKISYGLGGSKTGYDAAQIFAEKNLAANDWNWVKKYGYEVVDKNSFDINAAKTSVICTVFINIDAAGNRTVTKSILQYKTLTDEEFRQYKSNIRKICNNNKDVMVSRIDVIGGKVAVVKNTKTSSTNIITESANMIYAPKGTDLSSQNTVLNEMDLNSTTPGLMDQIIDKGKENIKEKGKEVHPTKNNLKNGGSGIHG